MIKQIMISHEVREQIKTARHQSLPEKSTLNLSPVDNEKESRKDVTFKMQ